MPIMDWFFQTLFPDSSTRSKRMVVENAETMRVSPLESSVIPLILSPWGDGAAKPSGQSSEPSGLSLWSGYSTSEEPLRVAMALLLDPRRTGGVVFPQVGSSWIEIPMGDMSCPSREMRWRRRVPTQKLSCHAIHVAWSSVLVAEMRGPKKPSAWPMISGEAGSVGQSAARFGVRVAISASEATISGRVIDRAFVSFIIGLRFKIQCNRNHASLDQLFGGSGLLWWNEKKPPGRRSALHSY